MLNKTVLVYIARGLKAVLEYEETEPDLIGEQTVLVGGLLELLKKDFEVLVELGYQPEVTYFEVINEAKLIMDLIYEKGFVGMLESVSDITKFGGLTVEPSVINERVKENMKRAAERVRSGESARIWVEEYRRGSENLRRLLEDIKKHRAETVDEMIRKISQSEQ